MSSMEDILKVLVNSRQQGGGSQQTADPMTDLIGGLLGSMQPPSTQSQNSGQPDLSSIMGLLGSMGGAQPAQASQPTTNLGGMMGLLEMFMGGNQNQPGAMNPSNNPMMMNNPIMGMLKPFVNDIAKKMNISPEIAMIVVTFVVHKLLSHHPTSQRDSNSFDLDNMLQQMNSGKIDSNLLNQSGMVRELSQKTGLDAATAERSLNTAFTMLGGQIAGAGVSGVRKGPGPGRPTIGGGVGKGGGKSSRN